MIPNSVHTYANSHDSTLCPYVHTLTRSRILFTRTQTLTIPNCVHRYTHSHDPKFYSHVHRLSRSKHCPHVYTITQINTDLSLRTHTHTILNSVQTYIHTNDLFSQILFSSTQTLTIPNCVNRYTHTHTITNSVRTYTN